jgi:hypothetical protein
MTRAATGSGDPGMVSPRAAGIAVTVVGAAIAITAAVFLANPTWGIVAAIALAIGTVLAGYGVLLIPRKSWADKTWPPSPAASRWDAARMRRQTLTFGILLVAVSAAGAFGILTVDEPADDETLRLWLLTALFAIAGVAMIVTSRRPVPMVDDPSDASAPETDDADAEWIPLGARGSAVRIEYGTLYPGQGLPILITLAFPILLRVDSWIATAGTVAVVIALPISILALQRRSRSPLVARDGAALRTGRTTVAATDITAAHLFATPWVPDATARSLTLTLEGRDGFRARVGLRLRGRRTLSAAATTRLIALVAASRIDLPRDKEDPSGRFSRVLYPAHLTKTQALEVIERPPGDGEPLPIMMGRES